MPYKMTAEKRPLFVLTWMEGAATPTEVQFTRSRRGIRASSCGKKSSSSTPTEGTPTSCTTKDSGEMQDFFLSSA
ncbi:hypothetical protein E2C01_060372 [Portunus trituberculatus]|uniref:Uncharacterized protein n=1 Tax=Portunus trituberculatus TaxID=210409 RepID=A0A5B7H9A0_PORTR|nr:hypothetical protein [Portunus trituberculatus]